MFNWFSSRSSNELEEYPFLEAFQSRWSPKNQDDLLPTMSVAAMMFLVAVERLNVKQPEMEFTKKRLNVLYQIPEEVSQQIFSLMNEGEIRISIAERNAYQEYLKDSYNRQEKNALLRLLFEVAAAGKVLSNTELATISRIAQSIGLSLSEFEIARLPYTAILESRRAGVEDKRNAERMQFPEPVLLEYHKKRRRQELHDISLSGLSFDSTTHMLPNEHIDVVLLNYFHFPAYVLRSESLGKSWRIMAEFDTDKKSFVSLRRLLHVREYLLEQCFSSEQIEVLSKVPYHIFAYIEDKNIKSFTTLKNRFIKYLETRERRGFPLTQALFSTSLDHLQLFTEIDQGSFVFNFQTLNNAGKILSDSLPDELATLTKVELVELTAFCLRTKKTILNFGRKKKKKRALQEISKELDLDFDRWWENK